MRNTSTNTQRSPVHWIQERLREKGATLLLVFDVNALICTWFLDHIAGSDRAIASWLS